MSPTARSASPSYARMLIRAQRRFDSRIAAAAPPVPAPPPVPHAGRRQPPRARAVVMLERAVA